MRSSFNEGLTVRCAKGRSVMLVSRSMASVRHRLFISAFKMFFGKGFLLIHTWNKFKTKLVGPFFNIINDPLSGPGIQIIFTKIHK